MLEKQPQKWDELLIVLGIKNYTKNVRKYIEPLETIGWITKTIPDKPQSSNQQSALTEMGEKVLAKLLRMK